MHKGAAMVIYDGTRLADGTVASSRLVWRWLERYAALAAGDEAGRAALWAVVAHLRDGADDPAAGTDEDGALLRLLLGAHGVLNAAAGGGWVYDPVALAVLRSLDETVYERIWRARRSVRFRRTYLALVAPAVCLRTGAHEPVLPAQYDQDEDTDETEQDGWY